MVQSGIAYAAGQLLAVVAPRTVLVVDAPTDWSLAGPLWELALDDAPVDEILDVLIRRGIRTAPSFAIVRVEADAVRALVRGSVPVCFERVGEPVRLDATGATTWLEGLISGARRVLVGAVETNSTLPYLVSTGVVLVSGLALPCSPTELEGRRSLTPAITEAPVDGPADPPGGYLDSPVPATAGAPGSSSGAASGSTFSSGAASGSSAGSSSFAPLAGREPRVVDLTRSEARNASRSGASSSVSPPRDSRSLASSWSGPERPAGPRPELNGHAPAGFDPLTAPTTDSPAESGPLPSYPRSPFESAPAANHPASALDAPAGFGAPSAFAPRSPFESAPTDSDDPGELLDLDEPRRESSSESRPSQPEPDNRSDSSADFRFAEHTENEVQSSPLTEVQPDPLTSTESYATPDAYAEPQPFADSPAYPEKQHTESPQYPERQPYKDPDYPDAQPFISSQYSSGQSYSSPPQYSPDSRFGSNDLWSPRSERTEQDQADAGQSAPHGQPAQHDQSAQHDQPAQHESAKPAVQAAHDDLLLDREDEAPAGPAPTDLPNLAAGTTSPEASGFGAADPGQPRSFGGVPAAWPPPSASAADQHSLSWLDQAEVPEAASAGQLSTFGRAEGEPESRDSAPAQEFDSQEPDLRDSAQPPLEDLPLRVRGRSLRPQSGPDSPEPVQPLASVSPLRSPSDNPFRSLNAPRGEVTPSGRDEPMAEESAPAGQDSGSSGLLLPAFFRGSRSPRKPEGDEADENRGAENRGADNVPAASPAWSSNASAPPPVTWVAPPPREVGDRSAFGAAPNPGLRSAGPNSVSPIRRDLDFDQSEQMPELANSAEPPREPPRLLGVWCDAGHVTSPDRDECRVCGLEVPPQAPILVARPPLGVLIFDNGDRIEVDRPVVMGRDPKPVASSADPESAVLHAVTSATGQVSRTHAEVRASGWDVVLTDLDAMNGTALTLPGSSPVAIEPGVATLITPGTRVDLGGETGFVFEIES